MDDLAVIIVTWNVRELVIGALQSLFSDLSATPLSAQVYVVDNASTDGTIEAVAEQFPQVTLICCHDNPGFGAANNRALRQIGFGNLESVDLPKAVYFLNPDTVTHPGATWALFDVLMSDSKIGLVGAALQYGDASFQHSAFSFPGLRQLWAEFFPTPGRFIEGSFNGRYPRQLYSSSQPFSVDFVLGATMMLRSEVIQRTGMFDEQFFMYCEEIDWAWRIHMAGWKVKCVPSAEVTHFGGQSTSQIRPQSFINLWTSRLLLFKKHYSPIKHLVAKLLVVLGMNWKLRALGRAPDLNWTDHKALVAAYHSVLERALRF